MGPPEEMIEPEVLLGVVGPISKAAALCGVFLVGTGLHRLHRLLFRGRHRDRRPERRQMFGLARRREKTASCLADARPCATDDDKRPVNRRPEGERLATSPTGAPAAGCAPSPLVRQFASSLAS